MCACVCVCKECACRSSNRRKSWSVSLLYECLCVSEAMECYTYHVFWVYRYLQCIVSIMTWKVTKLHKLLMYTGKQLYSIVNCLYFVYSIIVSIYSICSLYILITSLVALICLAGDIYKNKLLLVTQE